MPDANPLLARFRRQKQAAADVLRLCLGDEETQAAVTGDWIDLPGVPARLRVVGPLRGGTSGAYVAEVLYQDGARAPDVRVTEHVRALVMSGTFHLRRHLAGGAYVPHPAGGCFTLDHDEQHGWQVEGLGWNLLVFTPKTDSC